MDQTGRMRAGRLSRLCLSVRTAGLPQAPGQRAVLLYPRCSHVPGGVGGHLIVNAPSHNRPTTRY